MKRFRIGVAVLMAAVLCFGLTACRKNKDQQQTQPDVITETAPAEETQEASSEKAASGTSSDAPSSGETENTEGSAAQSSTGEGPAEEGPVIGDDTAEDPAKQSASEAASADQTREGTSDAEHASAAEPETTADGSGEENELPEDISRDENELPIIGPGTSSGVRYVDDPLIRFIIPDGSTQFATSLQMPLSDEYRAYLEAYSWKNLPADLAKMDREDKEKNGVTYIIWQDDARENYKRAYPDRVPANAAAAADLFYSNMANGSFTPSADLVGQSVNMNTYKLPGGGTMFIVGQHQYREGIIDRIVLFVFVDGPSGEIIELDVEYGDSNMRAAWEIIKNSFELK